MAWVNRALGGVIDVALSPFHAWPAEVGLGAVSLIVAIVMLLVFRATSDQRALAAVKRQIQAGIFEIRLFNDDVRALQSAAAVLRHNLTYLRLSLAPLPWVIIPLALLLAQLQFYYGYDGFAPGQSTVVTVRLKASAVGTGDAPALALDAPAGLSVQTPVVWIPADREAAWRIGLDAPGDHELRVVVDGQSATKRIRVSREVGWRTPGRFEAGIVNELLYPAEPPLASDLAIEAIEVAYPERRLNLLLFSSGWMVAFFVMVVAFTLLLRSRLGVII